MQIYRSKVPFYVNISNPDRVQRILAWFNRPVYCIFFYLKKKRSRKSWIFNPGDICNNLSIFTVFFGLYPLDPLSAQHQQHHQLPVEIRGKKNKKKYISFLPTPVY